MATRSIIGIKNENGSITTIYNHWDGYPSFVGLQLALNYRDPITVNTLMSFGDRSSLNGMPTVQDSYGETQNRKVDAVTYDSLDDLWNRRIANSDIEYFYIFQDSGWVAYRVDSLDDDYTVLGEIQPAVKFTMPALQ